MVAPVFDMTAAGIASGKYHPMSGIPTQLGVLHSAECPLRAGYARSLSDWAAVPLAQGGPEAGWQRFVDPSVRLRFIPDHLAAWHASEANPLSIGWEQAGYARFTRAEWTTPLGLIQLDNLAYDMAEVAKRDGLAARWLSTAEVRAVLDHGNRTIKGFCTHRQIDPESRTDPGDGYPYDLLMTRIRHYMGATTTKPQEGELSATDATRVINELTKAIKAVPAATMAVKVRRVVKDPKTGKATTVLVPVIQEIADTKTMAIQMAAQVAALQDVIKQLAAAPGQPVDLSAVEAAASRGAADALADLKATATVTLEQDAEVAP